MKDSSELQKEMYNFEEIVKKLNNGELLKMDGKWKDHKLKGVGDVCFISFPSLACFVGLGNTKYAYQMAKLAPVNTKKGSYFAALQKKLELKSDNCQPSNDANYYFSLWKAVGKSVDETVATIENSVCGWLRECKRTENFVKGQSLYTLTDHKNCVLEKKFNSKKWIEFRSPCQELK